MDLQNLSGTAEIPGERSPGQRGATVGPGGKWGTIVGGFHSGARVAGRGAIVAIVHLA